MFTQWYNLGDNKQRVFLQIMGHILINIDLTLKLIKALVSILQTAVIFRFNWFKRPIIY